MPRFFALHSVGAGVVDRAMVEGAGAHAKGAEGDYELSEFY